MITALLLSPMSASGCAEKASVPEAAAPVGDNVTANETTAQNAPESYIYDRVAIIGVDGAGAFFEKTDTPNCDKIFDGGSVTYGMLTSNPTISAECWGSLLHGVTPMFHRLTNGIVSEVPYDENSPYPSVFNLARQAYPTAALASFCNWNPINIGIVENGLDVYKDTAADAPLTDKIVAYLQDNDPKLLFVQFDEVDGAGHANGYGTPAHLKSITAADALIGKIYAAYEAAGRLDGTLFIVTADHGGTPGGGHGGDSDAEKYVYFAAAGKTVANAEPQDIEIRDLSAIAAYALGLDIPEGWTARVPDGVFTGVTATERNVVEIERAAHRQHESTPTPKVDSGAFVTDVLSNKLLAVLTFDGDITDATGTQRTEKTGKLYFTDGYNGNALRLDDGYVTLRGLKLSKGSFTVAAWLKTGGVSGDPVICSNKSWDSGSNRGFVLSLRPGDVKFNLGDGTHRMDAEYPLPMDYEDGWVHIILSVDRENKTVKFYYDFALASENAIPRELSDVSFDAVNAADALEFNIGQDGTGKYSSHLSALVDDFLLCDGAITDGEVGALADYYGVKAEN